MDMRRVKPEDIPVINEWFKSRKFPDMSNVLPSLGFIMEDAGLPVAACFVYRDVEGRICWLAWLVTRPGLPARKSVSVLKALVSAAEHDLGQMGYPLILASGRKGLGKLFIGLSWQAGDMNVNQYFKNIRLCGDATPGQVR